MPRHHLHHLQINNALHPATGFRMTTQPQCLMVPHNRPGRLRKRRGIQTLTDVAEECLIPIVTLRKILLQEPALDRQQWHPVQTDHRASHLGPGNAFNHGQFGDGLIFKQLPRCEMQTGFARLSHDVDAEDGIAPEFKKIVVHPYLLQFQNSRPDFRQLFLHRSLRLGKRTRQAAAVQIRPRQGRSVKLAIRRHRKCLQLHKGGRDHVIRKFAGQMRPQQFNTRRHAGPNIIGHQPLLAGFVLTGDDAGLADLGMLGEDALNLTQLNAESADFHLLINPAKELDVSVRSHPRQVTSAIQASFRATGQMIRNESLRRELRPF